jgi:hypothetical protein
MRKEGKNRRIFEQKSLGGKKRVVVLGGEEGEEEKNGRW